MRSLVWLGSRTVCSVMIALALSLVVVGCGDDDNGGNGNGKFGRVEGTVYLPFDLAAALQPAAGVTVTLTGGDFNQDRVTGADGKFAFNDAPARAMTLSFMPAACLSDTQVAVTVLDADTVSVEMTLRGEVAGDCISLPFAGASRMEIDPASNRAALLFDTSVRPKPALMVVNLGTGAISTVEFDDLEAVYDMTFLFSDIVVFNCLKPGTGYHLRFWNITTMALHRADIYYTSAPVQVAGHIVAAPNGADVFVTHQTRSGFTFDGQVFCLNVATGSYTDADNSTLDGQFAFDSSLVGGSVNWPYGVAIDADRSELLVANYNDTVVVAIDLAFWGTFNRSASLVAPIPGVRKIPMSTGVAGYKPWLWAFDGGRGVAASPSYGALAYASGEEQPSASITIGSSSFTSGQHHIAVSDARNSWFTLVTNPDRPQSVREAVEERSLDDLTLVERFETRYLETPALDPRAFAVNAATSKLYVAYTNKAILEVFPLD